MAFTPTRPPPSPSLFSPSPSASSSAALRAPISLRLLKVLGSSFDDPSTREALNVVGNYYGQGLPPPPERSLVAAEEEESESEEDEEREADVAERERDSDRRAAATGAAALARRGLRRDTQAKLAEGSRRFLGAFKEVDERLAALESNLDTMRRCCDDVERQLADASGATAPLLSAAEGLRSQRATNHLRSTILSLFLARFTLTLAEEHALSARTVPPGPELFAALDRVKQIRDEAVVLLSSAPPLPSDPDGAAEDPGRAGLDIVASTAAHLETGFEKLHRWVVAEFRTLYSREPGADVPPVLKEAVRRLREREELLKDALHTLTLTRHAHIQSTFQHALTRGLPRPIEIHAHEPTRYVGDMLAWVHQACASEREFLESLLGSRAGEGRWVGEARSWERGKSGEEEEDVRACLDGGVEGVCRPLRMRVLQTIKSQEGSITSFKIANLVQFYLVTMRNSIGPQAVLTRTLEEITETAYKVFFDTLDAAGRSLLRFLHPPDASLAPPLALRDATSILREILSVHSTSLVDDDDAKSETDELAERILDAGLEPALEMCHRMGGMLAPAGGEEGGKEWEKCVWEVNCEMWVLGVLQPFEAARNRVRKIGQGVEEKVKRLIELHYDRLLHTSGLYPILSTIRTKSDPTTPLSHLPSTSPRELSSALSTFSSFLSSIDPLTHPALAPLHPTASHLAVRVHAAALARVGRAYGEVEDAVRDPKARYEFVGTLLVRSREEVGAVLGVEGEQEEAGEKMRRGIGEAGMNGEESG